MAYVEIPTKKPWRPPPGAGTEPVVKEPWDEDEELKEDSPPTAPPTPALLPFNPGDTTTHTLRLIR
jgi:hypothetical protein